jgi:hypothetical protein
VVVLITKLSRWIQIKKIRSIQIQLVDGSIDKNSKEINSLPTQPTGSSLPKSKITTGQSTLHTKFS